MHYYYHTDAVHGEFLSPTDQSAIKRFRADGAYPTAREFGDGAWAVLRNQETGEIILDIGRTSGDVRTAGKRRGFAHIQRDRGNGYLRQRRSCFCREIRFC